MLPGNTAGSSGLTVAVDSSLAEAVGQLCLACNARLAHAVVTLILEGSVDTPAIHIEAAMGRSRIHLRICPELTSSLSDHVRRLHPWVPLAYLVECALATLARRDYGNTVPKQLPSLPCWLGATHEDDSLPA